jgi:hypothetical protein
MCVKIESDVQIQIQIVRIFKRYAKNKVLGSVSNTLKIKSRSYYPFYKRKSTYCLLRHIPAFHHTIL